MKCISINFHNDHLFQGLCKIFRTTFQCIIFLNCREKVLKICPKFDLNFAKVSCVRYLVSGVICHVSHVSFFSFFLFRTKQSGQSVEGLLSLGATPSSFKIIIETNLRKILHSYDLDTQWVEGKGRSGGVEGNIMKN